MRSNKWKHPNAYKHGVFNQITIVPGENPKEFAALLADLVHEWKPDGPTEEDAVLSIAQAMWRKRRAQTFLGIQLLKNICNPRHPAYDEYINLTFFAAYLRNKPETAFEEYASRCLQPDMIRLLEQKFPRSNFQVHGRVDAGDNRRNRDSPDSGEEASQRQDFGKNNFVDAVRRILH